MVSSSYIIYISTKKTSMFPRQNIPILKWADLSPIPTRLMLIGDVSYLLSVRIHHQVYPAVRDYSGKTWPDVGGASWIRQNQGEYFNPVHPSSLSTCIIPRHDSARSDSQGYVHVLVLPDTRSSHHSPQGTAVGERWCVRGGSHLRAQPEVHHHGAALRAVWPAHTWMVSIDSLISSKGETSFIHKPTSCPLVGLTASFPPWSVAGRCPWTRRRSGTCSTGPWTLCGSRTWTRCWTTTRSYVSALGRSWSSPMWAILTIWGNSLFLVIDFISMLLFHCDFQWSHIHVNQEQVTFRQGYL